MAPGPGLHLHRGELRGPEGHAPAQHPGYSQRLHGRGLPRGVPRLQRHDAGELLLHARLQQPGRRGSHQHDVLRPCREPRGRGARRLPLRGSEGRHGGEDLRGGLDVRPDQGVRPAEAGGDGDLRGRPRQRGLLLAHPPLRHRRQRPGRLHRHEGVLRGEQGRAHRADDRCPHVAPAGIRHERVQRLVDERGVRELGNTAGRLLLPERRLHREHHRQAGDDHRARDHPRLRLDREPVRHGRDPHQLVDRV